MTTENEQPKSAEEIFPYYDNPTDDLGIREWNQRMYDKREAYKLGESSAQQRIKELEEQSEWISVKDRLPDVAVNVLVFTGLKNPDDIMIGHINDQGWWWDEEANYLQIPVFYWMPLPEPPKKR